MNNNPKKILITSYYYLPETTPRAFRTYELVKEFIRRGYDVDLYIPFISNGDEIDNVGESLNKYFIKTKQINNLHNLENKRISKKKNNFISLVLHPLKKLANYILGDNPRTFLYGYNLYKKLVEKSSNNKYDLIISVGLPFYVHLGTALYIKKTKIHSVSVCDYGDPFFYNPANNKIHLLKLIEKLSIRQFDFISIPTEKSIEYYTSFIDRNKIKIIPQGFDFTNFRIGEYEENEVPTFCYAGIFYKNIRNPEFLLQYLSKLSTDFRLIIYTKPNDKFFKELFLKYQEILREKVIVYDFIPRESLIEVMSKMDFLINIENENSNQVPSKLIDYSLSERPILSINKQTFNESIFQDFLEGNYENSLQINLENYDIKHIVDEFEKLGQESK